jgi:hypothetical protein
LILTTLYALFWYGKLQIVGLPASTVVSINGKVYDTSSLENGLKLRPGSYGVQITNPLSKPVNLTVSVEVSSKKAINPGIEILDINSLADYVIRPNLAEDLNIAKVRLFEDNTWMTALIGSRSGQADAFYNIYQYRDRAWTIFDSGTGLDLEESSDNGYPDSVVRYLNGEEQ